jgi:multidrug efflux pump subunit AcrB
VNLTAFAIKNKTTSYFLTGLLLLAGISAFSSLGQLEDPDFSVKTAAVITPYPGASAKEVELEVTDLLEKAFQVGMSFGVKSKTHYANYPQGLGLHW